MDKFDSSEEEEEIRESPREHVVVGSSPFNIRQVACSTVLEVGLNPGMAIRAESDALVSAMPAKIKISSTTGQGGFIDAVSRYAAGESFFLQEIQAKSKAVVLRMTPKAFHGLAQIRQVQGEHYVRQDGFFACQPGIKISGTLGGLKEAMAQSWTLLKVTGRGWFVVEAFGGVEKICIPNGQTAIVDNNHLVAWPCDAKFDAKMAFGSIWDAIASGEWMVLKFHGPCDLYVSCARDQDIQERVGGGTKSETKRRQGDMAAIVSQGFQALRGDGKGLEAAVGGFFKGIGMIILLMFFLFIVLPRMFM